MSKSVKDMLKEKFGENSILYKLPIKEVNGNIDISMSNISSLIGSPIEVNGHFDCSYNQLTDLKGSPEYILGYFRCNGNNLISLEGAPEIVKDYFDCENQKSGKKFTEQDVKKVCDVRRTIYV